MTVNHTINPYWYLLSIFLIIVIWLAVEAWLHRHYLQRLSFRIHVNGTRGKSSVARLIGAGLRAGGITTCVKTTGTLATFIKPDASEEPIFRIGHTNIIEQIKVVRRAVRLGAKALVVECMAVQPLLQSLCELKLIKSTHGIVTNARPDHLDVMGPTPEDVAYALAGTMPVKGVFFTCEQRLIGTFKMAAKDRKTRLVQITEQDTEAITDQMLEGFCYKEYKDNVALALAVCESLGVQRQCALQGMYAAIPDPGALSVFKIQQEGHTLIFANGFAANDPESTLALWQKMLAEHPEVDEKILIINCRADRKQRSVQLAAALKDWPLPDKCIVIGSDDQTFIRALDKNIRSKMAVVAGSQFSREDILKQVLQSPQHVQLLVGIGNIAGVGFELVDYFRKWQNHGR